jgi:hypothetical protein
MIKKYAAKPKIIEAILFDGTNAFQVLDFMGISKDKAIVNHLNVYMDPQDGGLLIPTLEGIMHASQGDYIIKGIQGEFYPCKPDIFAVCYEELKPAKPTELSEEEREWIMETLATEELDE